VATRVTLTYADYAAIPNDGRRYEVHEPAGRLEAARPAALPPFPELALDPAALWP